MAERRSGTLEAAGEAASFAGPVSLTSIDEPGSEGPLLGLTPRVPDGITGTLTNPRISILNVPAEDDDPIDEIARIEARLEELAAVAERCRKIILVSKVAIGGGVALLLVMMTGLFGSNQVAAIGSIAVVLGGIVSLGSNASTLQQTRAAISAAELARSDLIGSIDLRVVGDSTRS